MNIINEYEVIIESFTERHFIKTFAKKYKGAWDLTLGFLVAEFKFIDVLFLKNTAEYITDRWADIALCKTEFKIAGTRISRHASGNRCIVAVHKNTSTIHVLLVYGKTDLSGGNETANWKNIIRENYRQYSKMI